MVYAMYLVKGENDSLLKSEKAKKRSTFHFVKILAQCSFVNAINIRCPTMQRLSLVANKTAPIPTNTRLYGLFYKSVALLRPHFEIMKIVYRETNHDIKSDSAVTYYQNLIVRYLEVWQQCAGFYFLPFFSINIVYSRGTANKGTEMKSM